MEDSAYWPRFCEENVWHLAGNIARDVDEAWVVFISNHERRVAIWEQKARAGRAMVWDYHVVLLESAGGRWRVTDPDSALETPIDANRYLAASFPPLPDEYSEFRPLFRLIAADIYRATLRSDRSHMRSASGRWFAPPPPGPPIGQSGAQAEGSNLMRFVEMERPFVGTVCDLAGLLSRIGHS